MTAPLGAVALGQLARPIGVLTLSRRAAHPLFDMRGDHTLGARQNARKRLPQLRHRKARSETARRIGSSMLLVWDRRVLCQPHRGQIGRLGSVASASSIPSADSSWSSYSDCFSGSLAISLLRPARFPCYQHGKVARRGMSGFAASHTSSQTPGRTTPPCGVR